MADIFFKTDAENLLRNKHVVLFGDSNTRATYKDLIWLLNHSKLIDQAALKKKQEKSFSGDKLVRNTELHRGRGYEEERSYKRKDFHIDFYFITRCYNPVLVDMMEDIHLGLREAPDVIYINSTLWDVNRWGPNGVIEFKDNLQKLARMFKSSLPPSTLVIWGTALPVASEVRSSLLVKQLDFLGRTLRFDVMEANQFAREVMVNHGFDVLDNHFYMKMQVHRRAHDGIHYYPTAIRFLTNLLLTHIALTWDVPLPKRVNTILLDKTKVLCGGKTTSPVPEVKTPKVLSNKAKKPPLPPHQLLSKMKGSQFKSPKNFKSNKARKYKGQRKVPYHRNGKNNYNQQQPATIFEHIRQSLVGEEDVGRRNCVWIKDSEEHSRWSETPHPPINPWINNAFLNTNWSEDHWPDGEPFQANRMSRMDATYNQNNILGRSGDLLARSVPQQPFSSRRCYPRY